LKTDSIDRIDSMPARADTACGQAVLEKNRVVIPDVQARLVDAGFREMARSIGFRAVHAIPLMPAGGLPQGVLATLFPEPHDVSPEEARDIDQLGGRIIPIIARLP